jgi:hypothetical protein
MSKALPLSRLIELVGDDNVRLDYLQETITGATARKKLKLTEISFLTSGITPNEVFGWTMNPPRVSVVGIMVWLPKALVDQALATHKAEPS